MILQVCFWVVLGLSTWIYTKRSKKYKWLEQFPGPTPVLPLIGNGLQFLSHPSDFDNIFRQNFTKFGKVWKLWMLNKPTLVTTDPKLIQKVLASATHLNKHFIYDDCISKCLGENSLITSKANQWKLDRKIVNNFFNRKILELSCEVCVSEWFKSSPQIILCDSRQPHDTLSFFKRFNLDVIFKSCNFEVTDKELDTTLSYVDRGLHILNAMFFKPWTRNKVWQKLFGIESTLKTFHYQNASLIRNKINSLKNITNNGDKSGREHSLFTPDCTDTDMNPTSSAIKEILCHVQIPFKWKYDQVISLIGAGVDTSAISITMTLFFLSWYPDCLKKAQEEIDLLFKKRRLATICFSDVMGLKYLKLCMKEAMRLHSPVPAIGRTIAEDINMEDGRVIPAGSSILIMISQLHMDPDVYINPEKFDPERFSEDNMISMKPYTYIPFSSGPRNCIGYKFAETVVLTTLALILRDFTVKSHQEPDSIKIVYELAGTPYPKINLTFNRRTDIPRNDP